VEHLHSAALLIILAVALTVATNLFSSAKLRETEFAVCVGGQSGR